MKTQILIFVQEQGMKRGVNNKAFYADLYSRKRRELEVTLWECGRFTGCCGRCVSILRLHGACTKIHALKMGWDRASVFTLYLKSF
jgi:hypothetical protein